MRGREFRENRWLKGLNPVDLETCNASSSFLQSGFWGSFKARFGWNARSFEALWENGKNDQDGESTAVRIPLLVIRRRLLPGISFAYVPWGPELPGNFPPDPAARNTALTELAESLKAYLPVNTAFIRFDPPWFSEGAGTPPPELYSPFVHAAADIQAPDTVLINLEGTMDAVLSKMKTKWRYNARLALKRGIVIRQKDEEGLDNFYSLLKETSKRDGISIHSIDYYKALFSHYRDYMSNTNRTEASLAPVIRLYLAEYERLPLAGIIVLFRGREAVYLYGASSNAKRNMMASYALQVRAMTDARDAGCLEYDLFGIPPNEDAAHPMAGLYRFKTGFGGRIIHRPGSWDYAYRPLTMKVFSFLESLRKKQRDFKKKKLAENLVQSPGNPEET